MYHVSTQGVDEHMINVHYYYCCKSPYIYKTDKKMKEKQAGLKVPKFSADAFLRFLYYIYVLHPISEVSPTLPLKQFQCSASSFHASLLQVISGVMSRAVCLQLVSQALFCMGGLLKLKFRYSFLQSDSKP